MMTNEVFAYAFGLMLSPLGLFVLAVLDSSMLFFLPAAVDAAIIVLVARHRELFWIFPILASAGSLAGAYVTFRIGAKIGENSLANWIPPHRLRSIQKKIGDKGAIALALPGVMPPPFPLTPFVLACGALGVRPSRFFLTLGLARLFRFGVVTGLALLYGRRILALLESDSFKTIVTCFLFVALAATAYSAVRIVRSTKPRKAADQGVA